MSVLLEFILGFDWYLMLWKNSKKLKLLYFKTANAFECCTSNIYEFLLTLWHDRVRLIVDDRRPRHSSGL